MKKLLLIIVLAVLLAPALFASPTFDLDCPNNLFKNFPKELQKMPEPNSCFEESYKDDDTHTLRCFAILFAAPPCNGGTVTTCGCKYGVRGWYDDQRRVSISDITNIMYSMNCPCHENPTIDDLATINKYAEIAVLNYLGGYIDGDGVAQYPLKPDPNGIFITEWFTASCWHLIPNPQLFYTQEPYQDPWHDPSCTPGLHKTSETILSSWDQPVALYVYSPCTTSLCCHRQVTAAFTEEVDVEGHVKGIYDVAIVEKNGKNVYLSEAHDAGSPPAVKCKDENNSSTNDCQGLCDKINYDFETLTVYTKLAKTVENELLGSTSNEVECNIYPNPGDGKFNFALVGAAKTNYKLSISDATGNVLMQMVVNVTDRSLDLSRLLNGVYYYTLQDGESVTRAKGFISVIK